jgi:hypothetical protein
MILSFFSFFLMIEVFSESGTFGQLSQSELLFNHRLSRTNKELGPKVNLLLFIYC